MFFLIAGFFFFPNFAENHRSHFGPPSPFNQDGTRCRSFRCFPSWLPYLFAIFFCWSPVAAFAQGISYVQAASGTPDTPSTAVSVNYPAAETAGDLNLVVVGWNNTAAAVQSVSDSGGNVYKLAVGPTVGPSLLQSIYYAPGIRSGSNTVKVSFSQAAVYPDVRILEYRGVNTLDATATGSGSGTSAKTTSASELIFAADMLQIITVGAGSGFTARVVSGDSNLAEDKTVTASGSYSATAKVSSGNWIIQMATFSNVSPPAAGVLSGLSCSTNAFTGAGSDTCTLSLSAAAGTGGVAVSLSSNNSAVTAPSSLSVPAGSSSASFTATVSAVSSAQTATLTASAGGLSSTFSLSLGACAPGLRISTTALNFGSVTVNTSSPAQAVTLTSSGAAALTLSAGSVSGAGFSISGASFPLTLNPGQTATLAVIFAPTASGTASGSITLSDNASPSTATISLSGAGQSAAPTVTGVSPGSGATAGGTAVTITGTNFASAATVTFGTAAASHVTVVNSSTITAMTPAGSAGAVTVSVAGNGQSGSLAGGFTYNAPATIAYVQGASGTPDTPLATVSVNYPAAQTGGDMNLVVVGWNNTAAAIQSVTDSAGNAYRLAVGPTVGPSLLQSIYYAPGIRSGNNTVKVTFSQAAVYPDVRILEYRGVSALDGIAVGSGSGNTASTGPATTSSANELLFAADMLETTTTGAGSGFTARIVSGDSNMAEDQIVTTAGSYTATAQVNSGNWVLQLATFSNATPPAGGVAGLTVGATSVAFGNVSLNSPATQTVTLTSSGTSALIISAGSVTGAGFSISGPAFPVTLNPGQVATLYVGFDPTSAGNATGAVTLTSNGSTGTTIINLSGSGETTSYQVALTWDAPANSSDPVAGYKIYRATGGTSSYQLMNASADVPTNYTDTTVQSGASYSYYVESVDAQGNQSVPSNTYTVNIP
jgi:hypothetical protein